MKPSLDVRESRRLFLKFLAGSPALAYFGLPAFAEQGPQSAIRYAGMGDGPIASPDDALNVFDFETVAERELPPAHWGYMATGTDDDATIRANRKGFEHFQLRARRLVDVREIDMSTEILGRKWPTPIVIAPTGSNQAFHADGELAVTRAAKAKETLQILSTVSSTSIEDVVEARGEPVWYQLYPRYSWDVTKAIVTRAERAGCPAIVLTVDLLGGSNRETVKRFAKTDMRECSVCHTEGPLTRPMYEGLDIPSGRNDYTRGLTWDYVRQVREHTSMKVLIKGIVTAEDAALAVEAGVMASSCRTTVVAPRPRCAPPSSACPRSSIRSAGGSPFSSTVVFAVGPISSKPSPSAPMPSASVGLIFGDSRRSGRQVSRQSWSY